MRSREDRRGPNGLLRWTSNGMPLSVRQYTRRSAFNDVFSGLSNLIPTIVHALFDGSGSRSAGRYSLLVSWEDSRRSASAKNGKDGALLPQ